MHWLLIIACFPALPNSLPRTGRSRSPASARARKWWANCSVGATGSTDMAKKQLVKIGLVQMAVPATKKAALEKAAKLIRAAAKKGAKIICLPELFNTPYFPQKDKLAKKQYAETVPGEAVKYLSALSKQLKVVMIVPIYELREGKYYNTAVVLNEGKFAGRYDKMHIPHDPGFYEKSYFEHGKAGYRVFKTKHAKFAALICYDQWYPEAARAARLDGAEIIFYPTAIGDIIGYKTEGDWHNAWETAQRGHAIANSVYVAGVNRTGREGQMRFFGQSFVSDPFGKIIKRASKSKDEAVVVQIDLERNRFFADGWGFLRNRRPDTYKALVAKKLTEKHRGLKNVPHYKDEIRALEGK